MRVRCGEALDAGSAKVHGDVVVLMPVGPALPGEPWRQYPHEGAWASSSDRRPVPRYVVSGSHPSEEGCARRSGGGPIGGLGAAKSSLQPGAADNCRQWILWAGAGLITLAGGTDRDQQVLRRVRRGL